MSLRRLIAVSVIVSILGACDPAPPAGKLLENGDDPFGIRMGTPISELKVEPVIRPNDVFVVRQLPRAHSVFSDVVVTTTGEGKVCKVYGNITGAPSEYVQNKFLDVRDELDREFRQENQRSSPDQEKPPFSKTWSRAGGWDVPDTISRITLSTTSVRTIPSSGGEGVASLEIGLILEFEFSNWRECRPNRRRP